MRVLICLLLGTISGCAGVCTSIGAGAGTKDLWSGKPSVADFNRRIDLAVNSVTKQIVSITENRGTRTVQNTLCPYDRAGWMVDTALSETTLFRVAHPDAEMRNAAAQAERRLQQLKSGLRLNGGVFAALRSLEINKEDAATRWYLEREIRAYKLAGVDRDETTRQKIAATRDEVDRMGQQFEKNIIDGGSQILIRDQKDMRGVPPDFLATHGKQPDGSTLLNTDPSTAMLVITYAQDPFLRRNMLHAFTNRGYPANRQLLRDIAAKRNELAHLLGYDTWADYASADLMSGTAKTIQAFIAQMDDATKDASARFLAELLALKRKDEPGAMVVDGDDSYYTDQLKRLKHGFDAQELRPYFPYEQTERGLLKTAAQLFHVTILPVKNEDVWDSTVSSWEVFENRRLIGRFFLDMHPRPGKGGGGSMKVLRVGIAGEQIPEGVLLCKYPVSQSGAPALLDHLEVVSMFHELGHLMNLMLGTQQWAGLSGLASERDFTEVPSQVMEEWMNDPTVVQQFAKHYQTGRVIPAALVKAAAEADRVGRAYEERFQILQSDLSLRLYSSRAGTVDPEQLWKESDEHFFMEPHDPDNHGYVSVTHWINMSSNYYSYNWGRVIKWDFLDQFDRQNLMADGPSWRYRRTILEPGSSKPATELVKDFLGRTQSIDAYRRWINEEYAISH